MHEQKEIPSTKFTSFVKNLKGFFLKKQKKRIKMIKEDENPHESEFFRTLKKMIILNLKKEYIINFFQKPSSNRAKIEIRSVTEYLCQNDKNIFFKKIKKFGIYKLYNIIEILNIEHYKKGEIIFQYKEPTNKFCIILEGKISNNLPYFHKKLISIQDFLDYLFYTKKKFPKIFTSIENKNKNIFDGLEQLKLNNYNMNSLSDINLETKKEFYIEETQKVSEINSGNSLGEISVLYNLPQNYNVIAENDIWILTMNRSDFMKIMRPIIEKEVLYKEFAKLRKYSYVFNSWSNFSLGQIMNYYIPVKLIKKENLFLQKNFSDSFYIIQDGIFDVFVEISLSEFSQYKNYILKNNKNILDWIREEKEKNKINLDKIIEYIHYMKETNAYPKEKKDLDKNINYIKKKMLEKNEENNEQIINIKLNEDILTEKNTKIKIKLFSLQKNDFIGFTDSLELKSRFYSVECNSDKGELNKIRILDFIIFIASNHGLDLNNIYEYIQEKKNAIVERVYKNLERYLKNNKRIINNAYAIAFKSFEKRKLKIHKTNNYTIKNIKNLYINSEGNNNLIDKIRKSINYHKIIYTLSHSQNLNIKSYKSHKKKQTEEKKNSGFKNINNIYQRTEENKSKLKIRLFEKSNKLMNKRIKTQTNLSLYSLSNSQYFKKKNKKYKIKETQTSNISKEIYSNNDNYLFKYNTEKEENKISKNNSINIAPVMYNKKFELIKYKKISFDNKLEKYLTNCLGIYNTKREKSHKHVNDDINNINNKKARQQIRHFDKKKLFFSNYIKNPQKLQKRIKSACPSLMANRTKNGKKQDILNIVKYLDKNKRKDIFKN